MLLGSVSVCLNFIEEGRCHVNGRPCILGPRGATAKNEGHECELHGHFDVWIANGNMLVTDLGFPPEEPVQTVALGVNETVALQIASDKSRLMRIPLTTSKRRCIQCAGSYWVSEHIHSSGFTRRAFVSFCPDCLGRFDLSTVEGKLGKNRYWCG